MKRLRGIVSLLIALAAAAIVAGMAAQPASADSPTDDPCVVISDDMQKSWLIDCDIDL
ncbi:hypothetical protein J5X84_31710 [Streptosporangiaceae bacterium NEAU-GS5]|nr:hypothetical protein [Streptosporangiaceae bacterium NEAU-GS5]